MASSKISGLTELTSAADGDFVPIVDISDTTQAATGTTKKIAKSNLIPDASETVKGKVELATDAETITGTDTTRAITPANYKNAFDDTLPAVITASTEKTTPADTDELGLVDSAASYALKKLTWANLKAALGLPISLSGAWPVGSIFISVVSTNPATLLGFGTWVSFGAGRVLVGFDSGQTEFDTVEETGGAKTNTVGIEPSSNRTYWYGGVAGNTGTASGADYLQASHDHPDINVSTLQPYIVVYMWKRTA